MHRSGTSSVTRLLNLAGAYFGPEGSATDPNAENPKGFDEVTYPGVLKNCEQCHVPGSYDFANSASSDAVGITGDQKEKRLLRATASSTMASTLPGTLSLSRYVTAGTNYGTSADANLVSSPTVAVCTGCHDSNLAVSHMRANGGTLYLEDRGVAVAGIAWSPKVGIRVGTEHAWRCYVVGSSAVSGRKTGVG